MNKKALQTSILGLSLLFLAPLSSRAQSTFYLSQESETEGQATVTETVEAAGSINIPQEQEQKNYNAYKTTWLKNRFKDTWFITLGSGAQIIMATDDGKAPIGSRATYAPSLTIGKYFSPIWGLRLNFTGGSLHGFNDGMNGTYRKWNSGEKYYQGKGYAENLNMSDIHVGAGFMTWDPSWVGRGFSTDAPLGSGKKIIYNGYDQTYRWEGAEQGKYYMQHFKYVAVNANFMFDLLTLIGNYNPKRPFEITPYGGVSFAHMFAAEGQSVYNTFGINGGLNFRVRLSDKFDFNLEGAMTAYPDEFDGQLGGRNFDLTAQAIGGITYRIGKSTWDVAEPVNYQQIQTLTQAINDLRSEVEAANEALKNCNEYKPLPETDTVVIQEEVVQPKELMFLPDPVLFRINQSVIDQAEWSKIQKAVDYLNKNPQANVVVTGYADKQTGYPEYNLKLSERRAKAVAKALVDKYNVNPLRISINWEGSKIQPFEVNSWNRVVIFVVEK